MEGETISPWAITQDAVHEYDFDVPYSNCFPRMERCFSDVHITSFEHYRILQDLIDAQMI